MNLRDKTSKSEAFRRTLLSVAVVGCFGIGAALGQPVGPQVINGNVSFTTQGNVLNITNTPNAIINWQGFSIAPNEVTRFIQQSGNSNVLNRVTGLESSAILGALQSNGRVYLINPNGILFGPNAHVDVNGLIASTLDINNQDFLAGKYKFTTGTVAGKLDNQGAISTPSGGQIVLIAPDIQNSGILTSPQGEILLAAGNSVQLVDTANPDMAVVVSAPDNQVLNLGQIIAQSGKIGIYGALINQRGRVSADSAVVGENGKIIFKTSKDTLLEAGSVTSATGVGQGGEIQVLGERVGLTDDAQVDASGQQGGGTILIGGDYQGKNPDIQNSTIAYFGPNASLKANGIANGDGGKVIVWADDTTRAYGSISARGGQQGGNGGFVETSGHRYLDVVGARVDTRAPQGTTGNWLLDPADLIVLHSTSSVAPIAASPFSAGSTNTNIYDFDINSWLSTSGLTLQTSSGGSGGSGDIVFNDPAIAVAFIGSTSGTSLTLNSYHDILLQGSLTNSSTVGTRTLVLHAGNSVTTPVSESFALVGSAGNAMYAQIDNGKTWSNSGTVTLSTNSAIWLRDGAGSYYATFSNLAGGIVNINGSDGWAFNTIPGDSSLASIVNNAGTINVNSATAFATAYNQSSTGTLNVKDVPLNLQNAGSIAGTINLTPAGATTFATLNVNEYHGTAASFVNTTISGAGPAGSTLTVSGNIGTPTANFSGIYAPDVQLNVGGADPGNASIVGDSLFKTVSYTSGTFAINNATLSINAGNYTIPAATTYTGNVGYRVRGDLTINSAFTLPGDLTLVGGWNGTGYAVNPGANTDIIFGVAGSLSTPGNIWLNAGNAVTQPATASIAANTLSIGNTNGNSLPGGVSMTGTNMVGTLAVDISGAGAGSLTFSNGQALTIDTVGTFHGIAAGGNTNPVNIATTGNLVVAQPILSGGTVTLNAGAGAISTGASGLITAPTIKLQNNPVLSGAIGASGTPLQTSSPGGSGNNADIYIGAASPYGPSAVYLSHTGDATLKSISTQSTATIDLSLNATGSLLTVPSGVTMSGANITLAADRMDLQGSANSITVGAGTLWLKPNTAARNIDLGSTLDGTGDPLGLSTSELDTLGGTGTLRIGALDAGNLNLSGPVAPASFSAGTLSLESGGTITQATVADIITANKLAIKAGGNVSLATAPNPVVNLAAQVTGAGGTNFSFKSSGALNVGANIDGLSGISAPGMVALTSGGALTQSTGALLGGTSVYAEGSKVDLHYANGSGVIAGKATGSNPGDIFSYTSSNGINVTTVNGFAGIQTAATSDVTGGVVLTGTNIHQDANAPIIAGAGTSGLSLTTTGDVFLNNSANSVGALTAAAGAGGLTFYNAGALTVGVSGNGVTTTANQPINMTTSGLVTVSAPVTAGVGTLGTVNLTGAGVTNSSTITGPGGVTINAGTGTLSNAAGVITNGGSSTGPISLIADSMTLVGGTIASTINGYSATNAGMVFLSAGSAGRNINLGSAAPNTLSILGTDLQTITAANALGIGGRPCGTPGTCILHSDTGGITISGAISSANLTGIGSGWGLLLVNNAGSIAVNAALTSPVDVNIINPLGGITISAPIAATAHNVSMSGSSVTNSGALSGSGIYIFADTLSLAGGTILAGANGAILDTYTASRPINLGSTVPNTLSILGTDLQTISSTGGLQIGDPGKNTGGITVANPISPTDLAGGITGTFYLESNTGPIAVNAALTSLIPVSLSTNGTIAVNNAQLSSGGTTTLSAGGGITVNASTADAAIMGTPDVNLTLGGDFAFTSSGGYKAYVSPSQPTTTHLTFTNPGGKVLFNGSQATATTSGDMGFFFGGAPGTGTPATLGTNLILTGGDANNFLVVTSPPPPSPPSLATCTAAPTTPGCSSVLPTLSACTANPTAAGCSAVLPPIAQCVLTPTAAGCSAVLPALDQCVTNPTLTGCTAVLPPLAQCVLTPTAAGCSAVLPPIAQCVLTPTATGCSAVLPALDQCVTNPTLAGCTAVLPPIAQCVLTPTAAGCSAVLPTLSQCTTNPTAAGCTVVLPPIAQCVLTPTAAGCSAVLPTIAQCALTPTATGCTVVLPTLSQCTSTPTAAGCSAVLPTLALCTLTPTAAGCTAVLPTLDQCTATPSLAGCSAVLPTTLSDLKGVGDKVNDTKPLDQTLNQTNNTLNSAGLSSVVNPLSTSPLLLATKESPQPSAPASGGGSAGAGRSAGSEPDNQADSTTAKDDKKTDDKKTDTVTQKEEKKEDAPKHKMYCN